MDNFTGDVQPPAKSGDVARLAGVSPATVSRAFNAPHLLDQQTLARVRDAAARLEYRPQGVARSLRSRRSLLVGVLIPSLRNTYFAQTVERVQALLAERVAYERMDDVPKARAAFEAALALDGATVAASEGLARLTETDSAEAYAKAMSSGYEAMAAARYDEARSAFERARKLNPTTAARDALAESIERSVAARIAAALASAGRSEQAERWDEAARAYATALGLDKGLTDLKPKADYARARAALASEIAAALAAPGGESRAGLSALLARAARIESAGPRLRAQRKQLEQALRALDQPAP